MKTSEIQPCFHCGEPCAEGAVAGEIQGRQQPFCCAGCLAVAATICDLGLAGYYRNRTAAARRADGAAPDQGRFTVFDDDLVQQGIVTAHADGWRGADLFVDGIRCGACGWLIRQRLAGLAGIRAVDLNFATRRLRFDWNPGETRLSAVMAALDGIGYTPHPNNRDNRRQAMDDQRRDLIRRLGVAAAFGMQIMVLSAALYAGDWFGIEDEYRTLMTRAALLCALPIVFYSARPFYAGAVRDLRQGSVGMDVPVSLGIVLAFLGSVAATVTGRGSVYFDSVAMFCVLLLAARLVELSGRRRVERELNQLVPLLPVKSRRRGARQGDGFETTATARLVPGDVVEVLTGETVPADGMIVEGAGSLDESLVTGESLPVERRTGDRVLAGSRVTGQALKLRVEKTGAASRAGLMERLVLEAQDSRPAVAVTADRVARWFAAAVVVIALAVAAWHLLGGNPAWLAVTVSVLVVTCPCALSLATPLAVSSSALSLYRRGFLVRRPTAVELLSRATDFVFDKTGTLTAGRPALSGIRVFGISRDRALQVAAGLEASSSHPLALAIRRGFDGRPATATEIDGSGAGGVSGMIDGRRWFIGSEAFVGAHAADDGFPGSGGAGTGSVAWLSDGSNPVAEFRFTDEPRPEAAGLVDRLVQTGRTVHIFSGDREAAVAPVARALGIEHYRSSMSPQDKLARLRELQAGGAVVAMVGDGLNDAPVLSGADVSISLNEVVNLSGDASDAIIVSNSLEPLRFAVDFASRTLRVIRQNLAWAAGYNLLALPLAVAGLVPPWLAALGMSLSSIIVVTNATRLLPSRRQGDGPAEPAWKLSTC